MRRQRERKRSTRHSDQQDNAQCQQVSATLLTTRRNSRAASSVELQASNHPMRCSATWLVRSREATSANQSAAVSKVVSPAARRTSEISSELRPSNTAQA